MIQPNSKHKKSKRSFLPSDEPVTMQDRFNSFYDQYLYDIDFDEHSEINSTELKKASVCAIWPRPRFMLQINTPLMGSRQHFYQNNFKIMPSINNHSTTSPIIYQKKKYHTKKDSYNEENTNKNNCKSTHSKAINISSGKANTTILQSNVQQNDQSFTIPQIQTNILQPSTNNSIDYTAQSQNNKESSMMKNGPTSQNQIKEDSNQLQVQENNLISDQKAIQSQNNSQPKIMYQPQQQQQQQLMAKKMKAKIIQHSLNVSGIQYALQQPDMMKMSSFQKLQQIQQIQKLQSKNKNQNQKNPNENDETDKNQNFGNEISNENEKEREIEKENDLQAKRKYKPRQNFSPQQKMLLEKFIYEHIDHPYAENKDLIMLEKQTNLSRKQIRVYMTNARMRKFSGNKIPVLKKSGNIVMRKGVPLQGPLPRIDPKNQSYIQCFPKNANAPQQLPMKLIINQSESTPSLSKASESSNVSQKDNDKQNI